MTKEKFNGLLGKILEIAPKGIQVTPKTMTAEGDRVAVEAESYAETITGKIYRNQYHFLITVRNGKVQSVKEYLDTMHTNEVFCQ
jgi:ketosteroid isomerase-like protein